MPSLRARADVARARLLAAGGDGPAAIALLEAALGQLDAADLPWLRATLLLELAQRHDEAGDHAAAVLDAKAAATVLAPLDVTVRPEHQRLLERLISAPEPPARTTSSVTLERDGRWWTVSDGSSRVRLPSTKGLCYVAELVARPGVEQHALDLVDRVEGCPGPDDAGPVDRRKLGDAGEVLDARARTAYRRRIEELRGRADDALEAGQLDTAEAVQAELDQLVGQLAQAFGLGGRSRRAASAGRTRPPQRHPGAAGRHRQADRGPAGGRRDPRSTGPNRPVLRVPTGRDRPGPLDRSVLTERTGPELNALGA